MATYATIEDVRREFKSLLDEGSVMTFDKIVEFLLQANAVINSHVGTLYQVPITGTAPINQIDTFTISAANDATEYFFTVAAFGVFKQYKFTSGTGATLASIRDGLVNLINDDKNRLIEATAGAGGTFTTESRAIGVAYILSALSTGPGELTSVASQAAVLGDYGLRLLRKIETELAACKVAEIMKTKIAARLENSGVRQEIKDGSCGALARSQLKAIQKGTVKLAGADLVNPGGGLESYAEQNNNEGEFKIQTRQW